MRPWMVGVVVGTEDVGWQDCRLAEGVVDDLPASGVAGADHREVRDVVDAHRTPSCLGCTRGRHEHHRVIEEAADLQQPCLVRADIDEGDVDVAGLDGVDQVGGLPRFMQHDLDAGPLRAEGPEEAGQDLGADARQCPDPQLALFA